MLTEWKNNSGICRFRTDASRKNKAVHERRNPSFCILHVGAQFPPIIVPTPVFEVFNGGAIDPDANAAITLAQNRLEWKRADPRIAGSPI